MPHLDSDFTRFKQLVEERFASILAKYAFKLEEARVHFPGMWVRYKNPTTVLGVDFEYGSDIWITLRDPHAGGYSLDELLMLKAPERVKLTPFPDFDEHLVDARLRERAEELQQYAGDILDGDFEVFSQLKRMRTERHWNQHMRVIERQLNAEEPHELELFDALQFLGKLTGIKVRHEWTQSKLDFDSGELTRAMRRWQFWKHAHSALFPASE